MGDDLEVRRANCLLGWFEEGQLVLENYLTGQQSVIHAVLLPLLGSVTVPETESAILTRMGGDEYRTVLDQLVGQDVLLQCGSDTERRDRLVHEHWVWGHDARFFHYSTGRTRFLYDLQTERDALVDRARLIPQPPPFKDYGKDDALGCRAEPIPADLWDTLLRRRTGREFTHSPLKSSELAAVLKWTWGITDIRQDPGVGVVALKTSPSGGARHPVEVYPVIRRVQGVDPGVYHYNAGADRLEQLRPGNFENEILHACTFQPWVSDAAAVFFMTGVVNRTAWKYEQSHAYRVLLLDAGHTGQTFHLVCTALDLSPWTSAALDERAAEALLGLDGVTEVVIYAAACGRKPAGSS